MTFAARSTRAFAWRRKARRWNATGPEKSTIAAAATIRTARYRSRFRGSSVSNRATNGNASRKPNQDLNSDAGHPELLKELGEVAVDPLGFGFAAIHGARRSDRLRSRLLVHAGASPAHVWAWTVSSPPRQLAKHSAGPTCAWRVGGVQRTAVSDHLAFDRLAASAETPMVIVTARAGDEADGCLVGFSTQCSIDPLRYLVCLSTANETYRITRNSTTLVVHPLHRHDRSLHRGSSAKRRHVGARQAGRLLLARRPGRNAGARGMRLVRGRHRLRGRSR